MIPIPVIDGHGFVFDTEVIRLLREKYTIPGVLVGTFPLFPQQNLFNGLPLQLLPEEVRYLLDTGEFYLTAPHSDPEKKEMVKFVEPEASRYPVFKFLIDSGYFVLPGLRFGCQYMAYPGDFMRYHSHYNVIGTSWTRQFNIIDIVNGGRLATSVKKCWVIGAEDPEGEVQVFSIEWAGFG